jgi:ferredoxin--NADP+ reductase
MTYVITGRCINDGACLNVCPVNSIHPTAEDANFTKADMLYIDPTTCISCNACAEACPTEAIMRASKLPPELAEYQQVNANFFGVTQGDRKEGNAL